MSGTSPVKGAVRVRVTTTAVESPGCIDAVAPLNAIAPEPGRPVITATICRSAIVTPVPVAATVRVMWLLALVSSVGTLSIPPEAPAGMTCWATLMPAGAPLTASRTSPVNVLFRVTVTGRLMVSPAATRMLSAPIAMEAVGAGGGSAAGA
jgi:hypothetical protein